jgi:hypothetical protein
MKRAAVDTRHVRGCTDQGLLLDAFGQVFECGVQSLCEWVSVGAAGLDAKAANSRLLTTLLLNHFPVLCRALRDRMRGEARFASVMFYERTRLGACRSGHLLEGMAGGLALFSGETNLTITDADVKKLRLCDLVADRVNTVSKLESFKNDSELFLTYGRDYVLSDLPPGLPPRVHIFVAHMRAVCQALRRVKPEANFSQCRNAQCNRLFYVGVKSESELGDEVATLMSSSEEYWNATAGCPEIKCEQREFCTFSCCTQWKQQLQQALPDVSPAFMIADFGCRKEGRARVFEALRKCGKRNEVAARHFRTIQKEQRSFSAIDDTDLAAQQQRWVRMLNVDFGVVFASSVLAESRALSASRVLPAAAEGWRTRPLFYLRVVKSVLATYKKFHKGVNVVSNLLIHEPFLARVRERASKLF